MNLGPEMKPGEETWTMGTKKEEMTCYKGESRDEGGISYTDRRVIQPPFVVSGLESPRHSGTGVTCA